MRLATIVAGLTGTGAVLARCRPRGAGTAVTGLQYGAINGSVVDMSDQPAAVGRIYLLDNAGLHTGLYVDVDTAGTFAFDHILTGDYQVSFMAPGQAVIGPGYENPVRVTVVANQTVSTVFHIEVGMLAANMVQIYVGDNFYQEQPYGEVNGTTTVKLGTDVCWYNVGRLEHTVTGGPWGDSGPLKTTQNFAWTANVTGTFPYYCTFHPTEMRATLVVTS